MEEQRAAQGSPKSGLQEANPESVKATGQNALTLNPTKADLELLALRAYPGFRYSGCCSRHIRHGHFECTICYPDLNGLLDAHMEVSGKLYDDLMALSGLSDPPNGRIGTNKIVAEIRRKLSA